MMMYIFICYTFAIVDIDTFSMNAAKLYMVWLFKIIMCTTLWEGVISKIITYSIAYCAKYNQRFWVAKSNQVASPATCCIVDESSCIVAISRRDF
jgi:hypothetical protein